MKIRQGFVSNSSSSSFVLVFPTKPNTKEDIKELLFLDKKRSDIIEYGGFKESVDSICTRIFKDSKKTKLKNILASLSELYYYETSYRSHRSYDSAERFYGYGKFLFNADSDECKEIKKNSIDQIQIFEKIDKIQSEIRHFVWEQMEKNEYTDSIEDYYREENDRKECMKKHPKYKEYMKAIRQYNLLNKANNRLAKICAKKHYDSLISHFKESFIMEAEYSDNGCGSIEYILEHGDIFNNIINYRLGHH